MAENEGKGSFDVNKAVDEVKKDRNLGLIAGGAVLLIIGLFLPWYSIGIGAFGISSSYSPGLNGTGILLLLMAVIAVGAALNVLKQDKKQMLIVSIVAAVVAILVVFQKSAPDLGGYGGNAYGYWVALIGSVVMGAGGVLKYLKEYGKK